MQQNASELPETPAPAVSFERLKKMFATAQEASRDNDELCRRDRAYYDGDQIAEDIRAELRARGQPVLNTNKIERAVNGIYGIIDAGESDPQAWPRNPNARDAADVATKTLRFIADQANYKEVRKKLSDNFVIQGTGAAIVEFLDGRPGLPGEITVKNIPWEDFFADPHSREHDFSDAAYLGIAKWQDADDVQAKFPAQFSEFGDCFDEPGGFFDDKAKTSSQWWVDPQRKRLRVIDMYYRDAFGAWHRALFCQRGIFYAKPSEYVDDRGRSICPIEAASYEVKRGDHVGERYGLVRNMIPLQDSLNARSSRLLHLVNHRQVQQVEQSVATSPKIASQQAAKADGVIPYGFKIEPTPDLAQGQMLILQQTMADLDRMAPTPAVLGRVASGSESGRARSMLMQAGLTELVRGLGRIESLETRVYKQMWWRARQFYSDPMWVRINSDIRAPDFLQINEPIMGEGPIPVMGPDGQPVVDPFTGQPLVTIGLTQIGTRNAVAEMDVDIIVTSVPDQTTIKQEVWRDMLEYAGSLQMHPLDPKFWALLKVSPITNARQMVEELEAAAKELAEKTGPAESAQMQAMQQAQQLEISTAEAKNMREIAQAKKADAEAGSIRFETAARALGSVPDASPGAVDGLLD